MMDQNSPDEIEPDELIKVFATEIERLQRCLASLKFSPENLVKRYALCYAAQCLDFSKALIALQGQCAVVSQYAIWRSLFEAYVRFMYLIASGRDCKEIQNQRLQNLQFEAYIDELKGINDVELDLATLTKNERRCDLEERKESLKRAGAEKKTIEAMLKELSNADHTSGWYPFFRMCSAKTHSRITDLERVYGQDGAGLKFPAKQSTEECHFIFHNAAKFLYFVRCGVAAL